MPVGFHEPRLTIPDYELLRVIGSGSYGEVWLARSVTGAYRAVKVVYRRRFEDERPFEREFRGIQKFEPVSRLHSSQVAVLHVGRAEDYFYYVMELADDASVGAEEGVPPADWNRAGIEHGQAGAAHPRAADLATPEQAELRPPAGHYEPYRPRTLKSELERRGRLPVEQCVRVALSLTTALEHLHGHGLTHRDIKPSNIIFVAGVPKLADIGLVAAMDGTLSFVGTEGFVPPEGPGSPAADLYSLGKVLYEMSTGRDRQEFPELPTRLCDASDRESLVELNEIILRACERDVRRRYQSAQDMHADLALLQAGKSVRRARGMERRLRVLSRFGVAAAVALAIAAVAWVYEQRQTRVARYWAEQSRQRLARLYSTQGIEALKNGDLLSALPWLVESLKLDQTSPMEPMQRFRIGLTLRQAPKLAGFWHQPEPFELVELNPNRHAVISASNSVVRIRDATTGRVRFEFNHASRVVHMDHNSADRVVTTTAAGEASVWDTASGRTIASLRDSEWIGEASVLSGDGQLVATAMRDRNGGGNRVQIWEANSGRMRAQPLALNGSIVAMRFSPDGRYLATLARSPFGPELMGWDARDGRRTFVSFNFNNGVRSFFFASEQSLFAGYAYGQIVHWDLATGISRSITPIAGDINSVCAASDGSRLAVGAKSLFGSSKGAASIQDVNTGQLAAPLILHPSGVQLASFSPDGRLLLTMCDDSAVRLWVAMTGDPAMSPLLHEGKLRHAAFAEGGRLVITITDRCVRVWDITRPAALTHMLDHADDVLCIMFSPDGRLIATADNHESLQLWNADSGAKIGPPLQRSGFVAQLAFSHDSRLLAAGGREGDVRIWDTATRRLVSTSPITGEPTRKLLFDREGRRLLVIRGAALHVLESGSGRALRPPIPLGGECRAVAWLPNQDLVITAVGPEKKGRLVTVNLATGETSPDPKVWDGEMLEFLNLKGSLALIAVQDDFSVRIWSAESGAALAPPLRHESPLAAISLSSTGTKLATLARDSIVRVWDTRTGELAAPPMPHFGGALDLHFSHDERRLAVATHDGVGLIYDCAPEQRTAVESAALALMVASREIDQTGALVPLNASRLEQLWRSLAPADEVSSSIHDALRWHRLQAQDCQRTHLRQGHGRHGQREDWQAAVYHWSRVLELDPSSGADWLARARAHLHLNHREEAQRDYNQARRLGARCENPDNDEALLELVAGDLETYRATCAQRLANAADSKDAGRINDSVWLACLAPDALSSYDLAVQWMRRLTEQRPTQNNIWNTYGAILYRAGRHHEALQALRQAVNNQPDPYGTVFDCMFLAGVHQRLGNDGEAREYFSRAIQMLEDPKGNLQWNWRLQLELLRNEIGQELRFD